MVLYNIVDIAEFVSDNKFLEYINIITIHITGTIADLWYLIVLLLQNTFILKRT